MRNKVVKILFMELQQLLQQRIVILDGAMGTMIQQHKLQEEDYRGERFKNHITSLKGCNDLLNLTQPEIIKQIHLEYLEAGADMIETNTFNATSISLADYKLEKFAYELNLEAAKIARHAIDKFMQKNSGAESKFIAGALGPTSKTASLSPDVNDPGYRAVNFDTLVKAYTEQIRGLMDGGVDVLLVETIFDTLNAKAALFAIREYFDVAGKEVPIMISGTITDQSGRTLSGQTPEAFYYSIEHAEPISVGFNCALGADMMRPYLEELANVATCFVSCYPNAGLPNQFGEYDDTPEHMAEILSEYAKEGLINIVGGCCGTTPAHIRAIAEAVRNVQPRKQSALSYDS